MRSIHSVLLLASSTVLLSLFVACSSSDDGAAAPSRPPTPPPASSSQTDGGGDGGQSSDNCFDTTKDKPVQQIDFLNQCNGTECFPFENGARIEGYTPGAPLPPLN